ncbi:MAG: type II toxin-antitoxin system RelB/DinJ family antitoxin [Ignavibacteriaceae bacterium]
MGTKTAQVKTRVEPKLKKESQKIFKRLGLSESEGVRLLLRGLVLHQGIPFELKIPNEETKQAIEDARNKKNLSKAYTDIDEMFKDMNK